MRRLRIRHFTEYRYPFPVVLNPHRLLLRPREGHDVRIETSRLDIKPAYSIRWQRDIFDNSLAVVQFLALSDTLSIASEVIIQHYEEAPFDFLIDDSALTYPFSYADGERPDLTAFQQPRFIDDQPAVNGWLQQFVIRGMSTFSALVALNQAISRQFRYQIREELGVQSPRQTLSCGSGSCRDFATLLIEACRILGFACRFVSGYLHAPATEVGNASTHAWVEIYLPGAGWKGFDPTIGEVTSASHIAVAVARDQEGVPPIAGSFVGPPGLMPVLRVDVQVSLIQ